jgi:hypothetical protein
MSAFRSALIITTTTVVLTIPSLLLAQIQGGEPGLVACTGLDCNWCSLVQTIQRLINFAIFLGTMCGAILFMWAGFLYITNGGSSENIGKAKRIFLAVLWGFVAILGGWLVIDTLMKALVGGPGSQFGPWNDFRCRSAEGVDGDALSIRRTNTRGLLGVDDDEYSVTSDGSGETSMSMKGSAGGVYNPDNHDGLDVRTFLQDAGVTFAKGPCSADDSDSDNCIDMGRTREYVVQQIASLPSACSGCTVSIERGSEQKERQRGQYTHITGYVVDIARNEDIDTFFINVLTSSTSDIYTDSCNNTYVKMDSVWRISIWNKCTL